MGVKDNTTEKIVGNASGAFTVQSIRRKSADDRYDAETLMSVTGVPWDPQASKRDDVFASSDCWGRSAATGAISAS